MAIATRKLTEKDLNRFERGILKNINKYGWHANGIRGEGSSPDWVYSVGLFAKYAQPELIVFGLEFETMHQMLARYADLLLAGHKFGDGAKISGISKNTPCVLREVHLPWREPLLRSASWYYHYDEYPVLQCFWPDRHGYFPWEEHCSKGSRKAQPLLYQRSVEKTGLPKSLLVDEPWRFADSPDTMCFTSNYVLKGSPITRVYHDYDGDWQFHGDQEANRVKPQSFACPASWKWILQSISCRTFPMVGWPNANRPSTSGNAASIIHFQALTTKATTWRTQCSCRSTVMDLGHHPKGDARIAK